MSETAEVRYPIWMEWVGGADEEQTYVESVVDKLWPNETIEEAALALCEEAGEVARAVIKRNHAAQGSGDREANDWTLALQKELAQVVVVAMKIAEREGFSLLAAVVAERDALDARWKALAKRPRGSDGIHTPVNDDGVTYCGWDGIDGCGELWPCSTVRATGGTEAQP